MKDPHQADKNASKLDRRDFLIGSALGLGALGIVSCSDSSGPGDPPATPDASPCNPDAAAPPATEFELEEVSIAELQEGMISGRWTAKQITELYLARIEAINQQGPSLRAVIETNPDAIAIAEALDEERRQGTVRGPLHGIPILLKDNIATADKTSTAAGSLALQGASSPADSFVAKRLRESGAVLLGKANLSEWANFRSFRASSGWSGRGRQCRTPYVLDRNPSGSSSGSAVSCGWIAR